MTFSVSQSVGHGHLPVSERLQASHRHRVESRRDAESACPCPVSFQQEAGKPRTPSQDPPVCTISQGRGQDAGRRSGGTSAIQHLITISHNLICVYVPLINVEGQRCFGYGVESFLGIKLSWV